MNLSKLIPILSLIVANISPQLREELKALVTRLDAKAKETKSPIDDIAVGLLRVLVGV